MSIIANNGALIRKIGGGLWTPENLNTSFWFYPDDELSLTTDEVDNVVSISDKNESGITGQLITLNGGSIKYNQSEINGRKCIQINGAGDVSVECFYEMSQNIQVKSALFVYQNYNPINIAHSIMGWGDGVEAFIDILLIGTTTFSFDGNTGTVRGAVSFNGSSFSSLLTNVDIQIPVSQTIVKMKWENAQNIQTIFARNFNSQRLSPDIDIATLILIPTDLTDMEWQKLEGWAAHTYALTANLPVDHPYKNTAPTI